MMMGMRVLMVCWIGLAGAGPVLGLELAVYGRVVDTRGVPVAGARLDFTYYPDPTQRFGGTTQEDGSYRINLSNLMTAVEEETAVRPGTLQLLPNYPNPFNPSTVIPYQLPEAAQVELSLYNVLGHRVRTLVDGWREAGAHSVVWEGRDQRGWGLAAGVYLCRLQAGSQVTTRKMMLLDGGGGAPVGGLPSPAAKTAQDTLAPGHRFTVYISGDDIDALRQLEVPIPPHAPLDFEVTRRFFVRSRADLAALFPDPESPITVRGSLSVTNSDLEDLEGLRSLREVEGSLVIYSNPQLKSIVGLRNLVRVGEQMGIGSNASLESLDGLQALVEVKGMLYVGPTEKLVNLEPLHGLSRVGGLYIDENRSLRNLEGLEGITVVQGAVGNDNQGPVHIARNPVLENLEGLDHLTRISGTFGRLEIIDNAILPNLDGLRNLEEIGSDLFVQGNPMLTDLGGLSRIGRVSDLTIRLNDRLRHLDGLEQLRYVRYLDIGQNPVLESLEALSGITEVGNTLQIHESPSLRTLEGLEGIHKVGGFLHISQNQVLTDLRGLDGLEIILGGLRIFDNPALVSLEGLEQLARIDRDLALTRNASLVRLDALERLAAVEQVRIFSNRALPAEEIEALAAGLRARGFAGPFDAGDNRDD